MHLCTHGIVHIDAAIEYGHDDLRLGECANALGQSHGDSREDAMSSVKLKSKNCIWSTTTPIYGSAIQSLKTHVGELIIAFINWPASGFARGVLGV